MLVIMIIPEIFFLSIPCHLLFFQQSVKNVEERYEKHVQMSKGDAYTKGNLLNYSYHQIYYKLIGTDLARQANISIL